MPVFLLVLGFGLVAAGLILAFGGLASDRAGGDARGIRLEGPAWLILVALGVGVIVFGVLQFGDGDERQTDPDPDTGFDDTVTFDEPFTFGDDLFLDDLWGFCSGGDFLACDELFFTSPIGSDYEWFGGTCGGLMADFSVAGVCAG